MWWCCPFGNKTPKMELILKAMSAKRFIPVLFCAYTLLWGGCTTENNGLGPLVYSQRSSGNISTILWPAGAARLSLNDTDAPDFCWHKTDSTLDSLSGHRGQVVLINFWATWCGYCKIEMPDIQAAANQMGDSLYVVGVSDDDPGNPFNTVQRYLNGLNYTYQFAIDSDWTLYEDYFPNQDGVLPQCCFIDPNGKLVYTVTGEENEDQILYYARLTSQK